MWDVTMAPDIIGSLASLLGGVAAIWGVCVAHMGLNTWKNQREADMAARVWADAHRYADSLHAIRFPYIGSDDQKLSVDISSLTVANDELRWARWRHSRVLLRELETTLALAELLWGAGASIAFQRVKGIETKIFRGITRHSRLVEEQERSVRSLNAGEISNEIWEADFDSRSPEILALLSLLDGVPDDDWGKQIRDSLKPLEVFLRAKSGAT